jgi:hypothetical protein
VRSPLNGRRPVAALLLVLHLAGCTSWHVETAPPAELIARKHPGRLRVEQSDGKRVMVYRPEVRGDSLVGQSSATSTESRAVGLADVGSVSTPHFNYGRAIGITLGVFVVVLAIIAKSLSDSFGSY